MNSQSEEPAVKVSAKHLKLEKKGTNWHRLKWMGIIGSYILMMFYTMVGGWMFYYAYLELSGKLAGLNADGVKETFNNMLGNPGSMMFLP